MIDESKLRPWQVAPAKYLLEILSKYDSALDSSDTGTGKTYVAVAVAQSLQLPTLVVAPKIAITSWLAVAEHFNEPISIINYELLRTGRTLLGVWQNNASMRVRGPALYFCRFCKGQYQQSETGIPCVAATDGLHSLERERRPKKFHGHFKFHDAVKFVIFDEIQRCSSMKDSLNSRLLVAAKRQKIKTLMLSATPFDSILKAKAIGFSLDLFYV